MNDSFASRSVFLSSLLTVVYCSPPVKSPRFSSSPLPARLIQSVWVVRHTVVKVGQHHELVELHLGEAGRAEKNVRSLDDELSIDPASEFPVVIRSSIAMFRLLSLNIASTQCHR